MKDFWDKRYAAEEMAYGTAPNEYFASKLIDLKGGKILFPAEGEGRNAIHAAKLGWDVKAFDISKEGKIKADKLALENDVKIDYIVGDLEHVNYQNESFDCIVLVFAHFPPPLKMLYHKRFANLLKKGGVIIFEGFSKSHLLLNEHNPQAGGPKNVEMLFSIEEVESYFTGFEIIELDEKEIVLNEGLYHVGKSAVIRYVGRKK